MADAPELVGTQVLMLRDLRRPRQLNFRTTGCPSSALQARTLAHPALTSLIVHVCGGFKRSSR
eukprot:6179090-Pleurochrysis_carterae.AAC.5